VHANIFCRCCCAQTTANAEFQTHYELKVVLCSLQDTALAHDVRTLLMALPIMHLRDKIGLHAVA
jgi:hypothetical protein